MMMTNLRTYRMAVDFFKAGRGVNFPGYLKDQWLRASSSIVLNIAEGYGKPTRKDRSKFFSIALGSLRECQAVLDLSDAGNHLRDRADALGGSLYKLIKAT
jgi:four helix bundle protein